MGSLPTAHLRESHQAHPCPGGQLDPLPALSLASTRSKKKGPGAWEKCLKQLIFVLMKLRSLLRERKLGDVDEKSQLQREETEVLREWGHVPDSLFTHSTEHLFITPVY